MTDFIQHYRAVEEYSQAVKEAQFNLSKMHMSVIKTFRHQMLFKQIQQSGEKYISSALEYCESMQNVENDWLQIRHPDRKQIHLEWCLANDGKPGFQCGPGEMLPFFFHIEMPDRQKMASLIFDRITKQLEMCCSQGKILLGELEKKEEELTWHNDTWKVKLLASCYRKSSNVLCVFCSRSVDATDLEHWLPELLECLPIKLLLALLTDDSFWKDKQF